MTGTYGKCPLSTRQIADEYFIENRHRLLDITAFLDRIDRSCDGENPDKDYRLKAFREALHLLTDPGPNRLQRMHMIFSDKTVEPREISDCKTAYGAFNPLTEVSK